MVQATRVPVKSLVGSHRVVYTTAKILGGSSGLTPAQPHDVLSQCYDHHAGSTSSPRYTLRHTFATSYLEATPGDLGGLVSLPSPSLRASPGARPAGHGDDLHRAERGGPAGQVGEDGQGTRVGSAMCLKKSRRNPVILLRIPGDMAVGFPPVARNASL